MRSAAGAADDAREDRQRAVVPRRRAERHLRAIEVDVVARPQFGDAPAARTLKRAVGVAPTLISSTATPSCSHAARPAVSASALRSPQCGDLALPIRRRSHARRGSSSPRNRSPGRPATRATKLGRAARLRIDAAAMKARRPP